MKTKSVWRACSALLLALCATAALAQMGQVRGTAKDAEGKPIVGAKVELFNAESGRRYTLTTNNKGEFLNIGIEYGAYQITLSKDGQQLDKINKLQITTGENPPIEFDLKKSQQQAAAQSGITPEQLQKMKEQQEKTVKENDVVKVLNEKLAAANQTSQAGDYEASIATLTEASQLDPNRDLIWFKLADAYRSSANKQTDTQEKSKRLDTAVADYQKAVDLKQKSMEGKPKDPVADKQLAAYFNNLGESYAKTGKIDEAVKSYNQAAQLAPDAAAQYYFNEGAVLTNTGKVDDAIAAFDKCIAADPTKAAAYYWKGVNMIGKASLKGDKMVAPEGTAEAFNKYLELEPTGQFADPAKQMLASIGATVETQFGKGKAATTKKK